MVDINKVNRNFVTIEKYLKVLDGFDFKDANDFNDRTNDYLAASMALFTILNASIEIGESLIELKKLDFPYTYRKIFQLLGNSKILDKELANKMSSFMHGRNMIAHQYDEIDFEDIFDVYNDRKVFLKFIKESKKYFL